MKELDCAVVMDLLPSYAENLVTEETKELIEHHLKTCDICRHLYQRTHTERRLATSSEKTTDKKMIRQMRFQYLWYSFWPLLYGICVQFQVRETLRLFLIATILGAGILIYSHVSEYTYDTDHAKKAYYERETAQNHVTQRTTIGQGFLWLLPLLIPTLLLLVPAIIKYAA